MEAKERARLVEEVKSSTWLKELEDGGKLHASFFGRDLRASWQPM